ncbi:MAG: hypothetical protein R2699_14615 [Acidimicrobiales bacterium]
MTLDPQQQKVLEKVRAPLAKAESTTFRPGPSSAPPRRRSCSAGTDRLEGLELADAGTGAGPVGGGSVIEAPTCDPSSTC